MRHPLGGSPVLTNPFGTAGKTKWYNFHDGEDFRANHANVYAPESGYVKYYYSNKGGWTQTLTIGNRVHYFHHLSRYIKNGKVKQGDLIAISGNSGLWTTARHLHWGLKINGKWVRPTDQIGEDMSNYDNEIRDLYNNLDARNKKQDKLFTLINGIHIKNEKQAIDIKTLKSSVVTLEKSKGLPVTQFTDDEIGFFRGLYNFAKVYFRK